MQGPWIRPIATTVFIDDYVKGRLPNVCTVSGELTPSHLTYRTAVTATSPLWFGLLLFPPVGWIVLLLVTSLGGRGQLTGELPLSDGAWQQIRSRNRAGVGVGLTAVLPIGLIVIAPDFLDTALLAAGLIAVVSGIITYYTGNAKLPQVDLDASGRWVTLRGIHPAFAEEVLRTEESRAAALRQRVLDVQHRSSSSLSLE